MGRDAEILWRPNDYRSYGSLRYNFAGKKSGCRRYMVTFAGRWHEKQLFGIWILHQQHITWMITNQASQSRYNRPRSTKAIGCVLYTRKVTIVPCPCHLQVKCYHFCLHSVVFDHLPVLRQPCDEWHQTRPGPWDTWLGQRARLGYTYRQAEDTKTNMHWNGWRGTWLRI